MDFSQIKLVTFDIFGTLVDWRRYVEASFPGRYVDFQRTAGEFERKQPFQSYAAVLHAAARELGSTESQASIFARRMGTAPLFSDSMALQEIQRGVALGCVAHSEPAHLVSVMQQLGVVWKVAELSSDWSGYKSNPATWSQVVDRVCQTHNLEPNEWLHVSANAPGDLSPAQKYGLRTCFIPRPSGSSATEAEALGVDLMVSDLWQLHEGWRAAQGRPIRYVVKIRFDHPKIGRNVVRWLRQEHAAEVLAHKDCLECRVIGSSPHQISCEYLFRNQQGFDHYVREFAPALQTKSAATFPSTMATFERSSETLEFEVFKTPGLS